MTAGTAALLAAALWLGCLRPGPWWLATVGIALLVVGAAGGDSARAAQRGAALAAGALVLVGSGLAGGRVALVDAGALPAAADVLHSAQLEAVVVSEPRATEHGAWFLVRVERMDGHRVRERALLRVDDLAAAPGLGTRIALTALPARLDRDGFHAHLRRLHAVVELTVVDGAPVEVAPPGRLLAVTSRIRERVRAAAAARLDTERAALLAGLVTGDTTGQSSAVGDAMRASGLSHLVAVSGANVALVLGAVLGLAAAAGLGVRGRARLGLVALAAFVVLVRWEPSVLRAAAVAAIVLAATLLGRIRDARHSLAVGVVVLLLADPLLAGQLGFGLSVCATAGVLVVAPAVAERLPGPRGLRQLVAACVGAQAAVAPLLLATPDGVPLAALPANLVAVPAAAVASGIGVAVAVVAQTSTALAGGIAWLAGPPLGAVLAVARVFAGGPRVQPATLLSPLVLAAAVAVLLRRRAPRLATVALVATAAVTLAAPLRRAPPVAALTLTALDVGQGDALLVEAPAADGSARMLVDGGPNPDAALRHLRRRGVQRLDAVVLSHPHHDHSGGLAAVLARLEVGAFVTAPGAGSGGDVPASAVAAFAVARERRIPVHEVAAGARFGLGTATVSVLGPPADLALADDVNDRSLVLRVDGGRGRLLLTGDAEEQAQRRLLARPDQLRAEVLKVPHHGGDTNAEGFLDAVGARVAVVSVGADNDYGHPHPDVLADLHPVPVLRTDTAGSVTVRADGATHDTAGGCAGGDDYTAAHAAPARLPVHRPRGAVAAPRCRPAPGRAARRGRPGGRRAARLRARRPGPAGPAHRVAVRDPPGGRDPRGPGPAGGGVERAARRAHRHAA